MISEVTRRDIVDFLVAEGVRWNGRLGEVEFLRRIFDLEKMPSTDGRRGFANAEDDIYQHRVRNSDWDDDWVFTYQPFNLLGAEEGVFLRFLAEMLHPVVRSNAEEVENLARVLNERLRIDGYELAKGGEISGRPVFSGKAVTEGDDLNSATCGSHSASGTPLFLTPEEVAQIVRVDLSTVEGWLSSGQLRGGKFAGAWRILENDVLEFLCETIRSQQLDIVQCSLSDPRVWARELAKHPGVRKEIEESQPREGTMAAFLKQGFLALKAEEQESASQPHRRSKEVPVSERHIEERSARMKIPNSVIYVVGDVIGKWYYSHTKLNTLFGGTGFPGDPPPGNCVQKCQDWLRRANESTEDPVDLLGRVLVEFMNLDLRGNPQWQSGFKEITEVLAKNGLAFELNGNIVAIPSGIAPSAAEATQIMRFKIALSFPGEHRAFAEQIAMVLSSHVGRDRVLYDKYWEGEFARPDLDVYLPNLYRTQSELIAIFLCADYAKKRWCKLEWRFIRQLICTSDEHRIMFLSFDDIGAVPEIGILSGDGYVSIGKRTPHEIADLILQRLRANATDSGAVPSSAPTPARRVSEPTVTPASPASALAVWKKKLAFLQIEEPKLTDPEQRFAIQQRITEAKEKIHELGGEIS